MASIEITSSFLGWNCPYYSKRGPINLYRRGKDDEQSKRSAQPAATSCALSSLLSSMSPQVLSCWSPSTVVVPAQLL